MKKNEILTNHQLAAWTKTVANKMEAGCHSSNCKINIKGKNANHSGVCRCLKTIEDELIEIASHISSMEIR